MVNIPICPSRQELQQYFTDARSLRAFEQLFGFSKTLYDATLNSAKGQYVFSTTASTAIAVTGTFYKASGTTTYSNLNRFTQTVNNAIVCNSDLSSNYMVHALIGVTGTVGDDIVVKIQKYNAVTALYETIATSIQQKIDTTIAVNGIANLSINDRIEIWLTNNTATNAVTVAENSQVLLYQI
jgi:hypothetical protein